MSETIIIGIVPPEDIQKRIQDIRSENSGIIEGSKYALHQPHMTIYINSFELEKAISALMDICLETDPFEIELNGINNFPKDPVTGEQVWKVDIADNESLKNLRNIIMRKLMSFQTPDQANRMFKLNKNYTGEQIKLIKKYATPISPEEFRFHITLFSTNKSKTSIGSYNIKQKLIIEKLDILRNDGSKFVFYKSIPLRKKQD
jgi:hypothetical protein